MFRHTIALVAGILFTDTFLRDVDTFVPQLLLLFFIWLCVLVSEFWMPYRLRLLYGCIMLLGFAVIGSMAVTVKWNLVRVNWEQQQGVYKGTIQEPPQPKPKTMACKVAMEDKLVLLYISKDSLSQHLQMGDEILFRTQIRSPRNAGNPGEFDYASYLLRHGISGTAYVAPGYWKKEPGVPKLTWKQQALRCREKLVERCRQWGMADEDRSVISALTLGYKEDLSDELRDNYSIAGISHVLALSGMHIGIIWWLLDWLLRSFKRKRSLRLLKWLVTSAVLWAFAFVVGLEASVVRAVLMCMLAELSMLNNSRPDSFNVLAIAAFFMLLYNPFYLFDVSFQLSFIAVASILMFYRRIRSLCPASRFLPVKVWEVISVSLAAQIGTAPLVMYYFGTCSIYFLLANLLAACCVPFIIYLGIFSFVFEGVSVIHSVCVKMLSAIVSLLNWGAVTVSHLPFASVLSWKPSRIEVCSLYLIILCVFFFWATKRKHALYRLLASMVLFLLVCLYGLSTRSDAPMLVFYNVSRCSAVHFIESDKSSSLMTSRPDSVFHYLRYVASSFWEKEGIQEPPLLPVDYESRHITRHNDIVRWHGVGVCMICDNRWRKKAVGKPVDVDYLYLCRGYWGGIEPLQRYCRFHTVVLDPSLPARRRKALKEECIRAGIKVTDLVEDGALCVTVP